MSDELKSSIKNARKIATLLDAQFGVGKLKFGLDSIVGLLPIAGDTIMLLFSSYIVLTAFKYKLPKVTRFKMIGNMMLDYIIGMIPVVGDLFDVAYKANLRNIELLERHIDEES